MSTATTTAVQRDLIEQFLDENPNGWNHDAWNGLLGRMAEAGIDTTNPEAIGLQLEQSRIRRILMGAQIKGLGPKRIETVISHYPTLWTLKCASEKDLAMIPNFFPRLAKSVKEEVNQRPL